MPWISILGQLYGLQRFPIFSLYLWCLYEQKPFYFNISECVNLFLYAVWFLYLALKNPFITQDQKGIFLYCALSFMVLPMIFIHGVNLASFWFSVSGKQPTPNFSGLKHFILLMDFVLGIQNELVWQFAPYSQGTNCARKFTFKMPSFCAHKCAFCACSLSFYMRFLSSRAISTVVVLLVS